ncbi:hypothetical protein GFPCMMHI_01244 [Ensifer adhaerens]|nr:hypothetical protein [Ensifer adhaerens]
MIMPGILPGTEEFPAFRGRDFRRNPEFLSEIAGGYPLIT